MEVSCLLLISACLAFGMIYCIRNWTKQHGERKQIRLFTHIVHDIHTPLTLIKVLLNELEEQETLSEQGKKSLATAKNNADKLSALAGELTDLLRIEDAGRKKQKNRERHGAIYTSTHNPASPDSPEKELLLLAEYDDDMRAFLTERLAPEYRVTSVADGAQTLEQAKELNPDIIISDVLMPTLRGDEMCRTLKSSMETSHIPVILLTALNEKEDIILGLEAGADDYITKPFDFTVLKARIRNILHSREKLRNLVLVSKTGLNDTDYANPLDKEFIAKAMLIIEKELDNADFSINDFCRTLGMSRTSVYNKIKTLTNQGPNDFIRIIRLNKAKELLKSRKYPIGEIAYMVGFSDPKYFSTSFKKQFGVSPSKVEKDA
jgi:DNA-binding response OmpR family regulator